MYMVGMAIVMTTPTVRLVWDVHVGVAVLMNAPGTATWRSMYMLLHKSLSSLSLKGEKT